MKLARSTIAIDAEKRDGVTVLHMSGDLDQRALPRAKKCLGDLMEANGGKVQVVFDLSRVRFIDSAGLGFVISSLKRVKQARGGLKLANLNAYMMGIFKLINLHYVVDVYDDTDKAIRSFERKGKSARSPRR